MHAGINVVLLRCFFIPRHTRRYIFFTLRLFLAPRNISGHTYYTFWGFFPFEIYLQVYFGHTYYTFWGFFPFEIYLQVYFLCFYTDISPKSTTASIIIVHNCLFCLQKHTLLHNYCAKQAQSGLQGSVCPMLPALRKCPRLPRLLLRLRLLQSLRVLLLHYPVCPDFLHLLLWRKILCGCLLRPA